MNYLLTGRWPSTKSGKCSKTCQSVCLCTLPVFGDLFWCFSGLFPLVVQPCPALELFSSSVPSSVTASVLTPIPPDRLPGYFNMPVLMLGWTVQFGPSFECSFHTPCTFTAFVPLWLVLLAYIPVSWLYFPFPSWLPLSKRHEYPLLVISSLLCVIVISQQPWLIHTINPGMILLYCLHSFTMFAYTFLRSPPPCYLESLPWIFILWITVSFFFHTITWNATKISL